MSMPPSIPARHLDFRVDSPSVTLCRYVIGAFSWPSTCEPMKCRRARDNQKKIFVSLRHNLHAVRTIDIYTVYYICLWSEQSEIRICVFKIG